MTEQRPPSIVVVGSCNLDIVVSGGPIPHPGQTVTAGSLSRSAGGKGLNQAIAASRMGGAVTMIGAVGNDGSAETVLAVLDQARVTRSHVRRVEVGTGTAVVTVDSHGDNAISVVPGANAHVRLTDSDRAALRAADVVLLQLEIPLAVVTEAARVASKAGALVVLTPAPVQELPPDLLRYVDVLVANQLEVNQLAEVADPVAAASQLARRGIATVVVTLGAAGCLWVGSTTGRHPATLVDAVDTTGAGDAFTGALAVGLAEGQLLASAIGLATAAAALSVQVCGASDSSPTRHEAELLIGAAP